MYRLTLLLGVGLHVVELRVIDEAGHTARDHVLVRVSSHSIKG